MMADVDGNVLDSDQSVVELQRMKLQLQDAELRAAKATGKYEAYQKVNKELLDLLFNPPELTMFNMDDDVSH